jgi:hypothetical protein
MPSPDPPVDRHLVVAIAGDEIASTAGEVVTEDRVRSPFAALSEHARTKRAVPVTRIPLNDGFPRDRPSSGARGGSLQSRHRVGMSGQVGDDFSRDSRSEGAPARRCRR